MTAYVVARIAIHDRERYARYAGAFMPVLQAHGGRLLAADDDPEVLEGEWDGRRLVLLAFETREAARTWLHSPEYQAIAQDRFAGADTIAVLAEGFPDAPPQGEPSRRD